VNPIFTMQPSQYIVTCVNEVERVFLGQLEVTNSVNCQGLLDCPGSEGVPGNNPNGVGGVA
jgi:hypothetical protein